MTPNSYQQRNWSMLKNYWMIFTSSIHLNQDHYDPKLPPFISSTPLFTFTTLQKKKKKKKISLIIFLIPYCRFLFY